MSVAPGRNPLPRKVWNQFRRILQQNGIYVEERELAFLDDTGGKHTSFAVLYVTEGGDNAWHEKDFKGKDDARPC